MKIFNIIIYIEYFFIVLTFFKVKDSTRGTSFREKICVLLLTKFNFQLVFMFFFHKIYLFFEDLSFFLNRLVELVDRGIEMRYEKWAMCIRENILDNLNELKKAQILSNENI